MKTFFTAWIAVITLYIGLAAQTRPVQGKVSEIQTGKPLDDVTVSIKESGIATQTSADGQYHFTAAPKKTIILRFEKLGYRPVQSVLEVDAQTLIVAMEPANLSLGEVYVNSTKYGELLKETPIPMEIIEAKTIALKPLIGVSDAFRNQPGLAVVRDGMWGTDVNIRGLSRQNIVTLVDGNRIETASNHAASLSLVDVLDVESIEVIKGGISSLYGTGATGGVVAISTRKPKYTENFTLSGNASSAFTSANNGGAGNVTLMAAQSFWYAKAGATMRTAENVRTPDGTLKNSYFRDKNYTASAGVMPFEGHQLLLDFQRFHGEDIGIPGGRSFPAAAQARYTEASRTMYSVEYKIKDLLPSLFSTSLKYFNQKITRAVELKPTATQTLAPAADHKTFGVQLQTNWLVCSNAQLVGGIDYWQREYNGFRTTTVKSGSTVKVTADLPVPDSKYKSFGVFAQNEMRLLEDKLRVTVGARYDFINISNDAVKNPLYVETNGVRTYPAANKMASFTASDNDDKSWSANVGLMYKVSNNVDAVLNASHAFRSPVLEERFQYINLGGDIFLGNPELEPEIGNFFDAGIRYWSDRLTARINGFYNTFTNLVVDEVVIKDSLYKKANIGKAALYGFDASVEYLILPGVTVYTNAAYVRGEDTRNNVNLPQIPPFSGMTGCKYRVPEIVSLEANAQWTATQKNVASAELVTGGYTVYNFYASSEEYTLFQVHTRLHAGVENIFDRAYRDHLASTRGVLKLEPGRNVFVKLSVNW